MKKTIKTTKVKAEVLKDVTVNQTVNLSLSQDDLVNIIIQEKLESLNIQKELLNKSILITKTEIEKLLEDGGKILSKGLKVSFNKKSLSGFEFKLDTTYDYKTSPRIPILNVESTSGLKSKSYSTYNINDIITVNLTLADYGFKIKDKEFKNLGIDSTLNIVNVHLKTFNNALFRAYTELSQINEEIIQLTYNSKAMKAKLLKEILSQSAAGQEVLELVKKIKGEKLLSAEA